MSAEQLRKWPSWLPTVLMVGIILIVVTVGVVSIIFASGPEGFVNKSEHGYYYETSARTFPTAADRRLATDTIIKLCKQDGDIYTTEQVRNLSDAFLLLVLDPEDEDESKELRAQMAMLVDPTYPAAHLAVTRAHKQNGDRLAGSVERQLVYSLLVNYFMRIRNPTGVPIERWTDALLIRTFLTRTMPKYTEFGG